MLENHTGQWVASDSFFDRKEEIASFWRALETDSVLLLAPRRVGKTSVLRFMKDTAGEQGLVSVFVDVSDCGDELKFVQRLYSAIMEHHNKAERLWNTIKESRIGKTIRSVKKVGGAGFNLEFDSQEAQWARMGEELAQALEALESKTLIQVDELPVFALKLLNHADETNQARIREFLYWLRRLRQDYRHVRWMLAGSIGLDTVAARLNIADSINDLRIESLGAFDTPTAHDLLKALATSYKLKLAEPVRNRILERVGWLLPYYLQLVFHEIRGLKEPTVEDVDCAVDRLIDPQHKTLFDYWRQRLRDELGRPDADHAALLLNAACRTPEGARRSIFRQVLNAGIPDADAREEKLRYLLDVLTNDGYVVEQDKFWQFRSPLLREYWLRRVAPPESGDE
jgi:hypothetical protein